MRSTALALALLFTFTSSQLVAQSAAGEKAKTTETAQSTFSPRVIWGGAAYLNFWGDYKTLGLSPTVGLLWHPKVYSGLGVTYMYTWADLNDYSAHILGGRLFTNYYIVPQAFLRAEFEYRYFMQEWKVLGSTFEDEYGVPMLFLGAGYRQPVGPRTYLEVHMVVDVLNDSKSPYKKWDPIIGVGIVTGF